jgi:hypothetical protein
MTTIIRCISCAGYGWLEDDFSGVAADCDWCAGIGYVYRDAAGIDERIPLGDLQKADVSDKLEALESERMRAIGYSGAAKKPWQQDIRRGTQGGVNPYEDE